MCRTMVAESNPPERNAPSGTSLISFCCTVVRQPFVEIGEPLFGGHVDGRVVGQLPVELLVAFLPDDPGRSSPFPQHAASTRARGCSLEPGRSRNAGSPPGPASDSCSPDKFAPEHRLQFGGEGDATARRWRRTSVSRRRDRGQSNSWRLRRSRMANANMPRTRSTADRDRPIPLIVDEHFGVRVMGAKPVPAAAQLRCGVRRGCRSRR